MADDLLKTLITQATSILVQRVRLECNQVVSIKDDINKLKTTLGSIQAGVRDAEKKQIEQQNIRIWVKKLKRTSYEIHDALTDWNEAIREVNGNTSRSNLRKYLCLAIAFPCVSSKRMSPLRNVAIKIRNINKRLVSIDSDKNAFGLISNPNDEEAVLIEPQLEYQTSSFAATSTIYGRDIEKNDILRILTSESSPSIVFIWGMGGIGKTTLAQLIVRSIDQVEHNFNIKMWVHVGQTCDITKLAKAIVEQIQDQTMLYGSPLDRVCGLVNQKKFLLVLDNVWDENLNSWKPLFVALGNGAPGSKILITSRNQGVGRTINSVVTGVELFSSGSVTYMHQLKELPDEDTWTIFSKSAFAERNDDFFDRFKVTGRKISDKCKGLPLAAETVGSLMVLKDTKDEWENILNDRIWQLELGDRVSNPLLLSYYDLPSVMKRCFCYCANFCKDTKIDAVNLIQMWMSQGYLGSGGTDEMEITGRGYLHSLVRRSLFQDPERNKDDGTVLRFKMHDMVHDVARYLMEDECLMVTETDNEVNLNSEPKVNGPYRHLTILREDNVTIHVPPKRSERLYSFLVQSFHDCPEIVTKDCLELLPRFFDHFKYLKTLDMSCNMLKTLPDDIQKLKNLCFLNLSHNPLSKLPETICNLPNLQTLKLVSCIHLTELPQNISKLESLRHLEIDDTRNLVTLPKGVGRLTSLRTLSRFLIGGEDESCSLGDLKHLNHLRGCLKIEGLDHADISEAKEAELEKKEHLVDLHINCTLGSDVIDALQLNSNLNTLQIDNYGGQRFPSWMGSLTNLNKVRLQKWDRCTCLPNLAKLPFLKVLHIESFKALENVDSEFVGVETDAFPKLEKLKFSHLEKWEKWNVTMNARIMPCLGYLKLSHCEKLQSLPREIINVGRIKKLRIRGCAILKRRYQKEIGEDWEMISHISNVRIH